MKATKETLRHMIKSQDKAAKSLTRKALEIAKKASDKRDIEKLGKEATWHNDKLLEDLK